MLTTRPPQQSGLRAAKLMGPRWASRGDRQGSLAGILRRGCRCPCRCCDVIGLLATATGVARTFAVEVTQGGYWVSLPYCRANARRFSSDSEGAAFGAGVCNEFGVLGTEGSLTASAPSSLALSGS